MSRPPGITYPEIVAARRELRALEDAYLRRFGWTPLDHGSYGVRSWTLTVEGRKVVLGHRTALAYTSAELDKS